MKYFFLSVLFCCLFGISPQLLGVPVISGAISDGRLFYKKGETAVHELARAIGKDDGYVSRIIRLTFP